MNALAAEEVKGGGGGGSRQENVVKWGKGRGGRTKLYILFIDCSPRS